jgi:glycosyltransferase involved in cell wall biosynthesis
MNGDKATFFGALVKKIYFPNLKIIHHEHSGIFRNDYIYNLMLKFCEKNIDLFLAVSESTKIALIKKAKISETKIETIYNFVDYSKFRIDTNYSTIEEEKRKLEIADNDFVIGFVGRLLKIKGCEYLIKSLPFLEFNYRLLIIGDGKLKKKLERLCLKLGVMNNVSFFGYVNDMPKIYSLLDICVMPSLSEASPMVFYEAQSFGIPIIGSDVPAINEFIIPNKNGFLFEVKNSKDLANKITLLYKDNFLRLKMREYSISNIKKYSLSNYLRNLEMIYLKVE